MATYYVATTGNDSTGDGSSGTPWLTISKAFATVAAGDTVNILPGTYAENTSATGRLQITKVFASNTVFQSSTGTASDVVITGASDATINTILQSNAAWIEFKNVTFGMRVNTNAHALRLANATNITFTNCVFTVKTNSGQVNAGVNVQPSGAGTDSPITFTGCTFNASGTDNARGVAVVWTANNVIGVTFNNCQSNMTGDSLYFNGGTVTVNGGTWLSAANHALLFGADSNTGGNACTANVTNATITCTAGHALIFGNGCVSCVASGNTLVGGDYAIVLKEHSGSWAYSNTITGGTAAACYFKAASSASLSGNAITCASGAALKVGAGDTGNKNLSNYYWQNDVVLTGTANAYDWAGSAADGGSAIANYNAFHFRGSGSMGQVYGVAVNRLSDAAAAWRGSYTNANDQRSATNLPTWTRYWGGRQ